MNQFVSFFSTLEHVFTFEGALEGEAGYLVCHFGGLVGEVGMKVADFLETGLLLHDQKKRQKCNQGPQLRSALGLGQLWLSDRRKLEPMGHD
jgi:hypothetical protein